MRRKSDADEILDHIKEIAPSLRLPRSRRWWTKWLFRSDHVENAAQILNCGVLLSRAAAEDRGVIVKDSGSPTYLADLSDEQRRYVRLYFRPRTPTQFVNEGIRPASMIQYEAHMPVPVYLLFSVSLLVQEGVGFTRGRLSPTTEIGSTAAFLRSIPFKDVYHDAPVGPRGSERRAEILNARHAEVLVRDVLPLSQLRLIVCRSAPERDTLVSLLDSTAKNRWISRIIVDEGAGRLFNKQGVYIQKVTLSAEASEFIFSADVEPEWRGPFQLYIRWDPEGWHFRRDNFRTGRRSLAIRLPSASEFYQVRLRMNGDLAFSGEYHDSQSLPF